MIKVGIITTPLKSADSVRGVGFYAKRLLEAIKPQAKGAGVEVVENRHTEVDVVHYPFFTPFFHTLPILRPAKTVVTIHDVIPLEFPAHYPPGIKGNINLLLQKLALSSVDRVITDSYASVKAIRKHLKVPHEKIKLIYLAADKKFKPVTDKQKLEKVRSKYQLPKKFALYVGDVNWNKNISGLIQACEKIKYSLVIIGKMAKEIERMDLSHPELRHLRKTDFSKVIRLGFVSDEDLIAVYNLAKVYCQPSFAEGFGLPVLEAMACGTAVAVSNTHSLPEIAGNAAAYFDPRNINDMAHALKSANSQGVVAQADKFTWEKTASETLRMYKGLWS